jgi:acetolactate synthase-1/2/3 large subunit
MPHKTMKDATVSDAYLALLADRGVEYLFANAGTDFAPLIEALAKAQALGTPCPTPVTCPHENTAMHMAIGYYLVTGKPQAVMVHVNVGTANGMNGLLNAARGNIPLLFTAGRTPTNEDKLAGHRSLDIHWTQEMFDQAGMVRGAAKWDYELRNGEQVETVVDRMLTVAMSEPRGPIYLALPREVLTSKIGEFTYNSPTRQHAASPSVPNAAALDEAAAMLAGATSPLIITAWAGRSPETWQALGDFAERYAIPVVQYRNRYMSIASHHPMNLGYDPAKLLAKADVVLVIDTAVPWLPAEHELRDDVKVIQMAPDPLYGYVPIRGFPGDIALTCTTSLGLDALAEAMSAHEKDAKSRTESRRGDLATQHKEMRDDWQQRLKDSEDKDPISPIWLTHCIDNIKDDDTIVIKESPLLPPFIDFNQPGTMLNAGAASGLGWGSGTALGAKLAAPDRTVISTHGDGAYMFGNPTSAHYVAAEQDLPILSVIFNNQLWNAVRRSTVGLTPDGYAAKANRQPLTYFEGEQRYEKVVEVSGGYGEQVTSPKEVMGALERGMKAVDVEKRSAVINVVCTA